MKTLLQIASCFLVLIAVASNPAPVNSMDAFTYQGRLNGPSGPADGAYDFSFALYSQAVGGPPVTTALFTDRVMVSNGLFVVNLQFPNAFNGANRWLEISVRSNGTPTYVTLSPRQQITAAPYAIRAKEALGVPAGTITGAMLADGSVTGAKLGFGAANQNLLASGAAPVVPGGVVMSDDPTNAALTAQGYVRIPNAESSLTQEKWTQHRPPAATAEFIPPTQHEIVVAAGSEVIVIRFFESYDVEAIHYNPANGEWTKGGSRSVSWNSAAPVAPGAVAVWTGSQVLLFGGENSYSTDERWVYENPNRVAIYTPATRSWSLVNGNGAIPAGRTRHTAVWTGSRMVIWGGERVVTAGPTFFTYQTRVDLNDGAAFDPVTGSWTAITTNGAPSPRRGHTAVWTGSRMIVHGGTQNNREQRVDEDWPPVEMSPTNVFNNGFSFNPANNTWAPIRSDGGSPRHAFGQAVWTGTEMYVAGGLIPAYVTYETGFGSAQGWQWIPTRAVSSYNPATDFWTLRGVPDATGTNVNGRRYGTLTWTGQDVVIAGGEGLNETNYFPYPRKDLQAYNVANAGWRTLPFSPLDGGVGSQAAWVSNRLVLCDAPKLVSSGFSSAYTNPKRAAYNPANNTWETLRNYFGPEPLKQDDPSVVWTGTELIIWGGPVNGVPSNRGRRFHLATRTWKEMSTTNAPAARMRHSAVWTGSRMVIWGGDSGGDSIYPNAVYSDGGAYDPVTDTWHPISPAPNDHTTGEPFKRTGHKAVWTTFGMLVVGGSDGYNNQGYNFPHSIALLSSTLTNGWTLEADDPIVGRYYHGLATDGGRQVLLWGGQNEPIQSPIGSGILIDAETLLPVRITNEDEPTPAHRPAITWGGKEFIVWGGDIHGNTALGGGARFNPTLGTWTQPQFGGPVLTTPFARHSAVWSGTELLLWGGPTNSSAARYNPRNDGFTPMSTGPAMRQNAFGAWTGNSMLLYLPALPAQGSVPELWEYTPPAKLFFYLKQ
jgi:hypothetical protein